MLTASVYPPILSPSTGLIYDNLFDYHTGRYNQVRSATIGFDSMSIDIMVHDPELRDWLTNGIGRHIEVYASSGVVWEGFVNDITIVVGATTIKIGPLLDIANSINVSYTTRQWATNPPIGGEAAETGFSGDAESIGRWGTFQQVISGGEGVAATMSALLASKLNELAWPKISHDFSAGAGGTKTITLSCKGYYHMLARYLFTANSLDTDTANISSKLEDVLNDDPDDLFTGSNASIVNNTLQVPGVDDGSRDGLTVIQELIGLGFASGQRALLSVGPNRHVTYKALELDKEALYVYSMYDQYPSMALRDGTAVKPWDILPGEWIEIESVSSRPFSSNLPRHSDPKYIFVESVNFSDPNEFTIQGGLGNTLKQKLARNYGLELSSG